MKKLIAILAALAVMMTMASAVACTRYCGEFDDYYDCFDDDGEYDDYDDYYDDDDDEEPQPMYWTAYMANHNFPTGVIRDVSYMRDRYNGTAVNCLGLMSNQGSNLRSETNFADETIIRKLHADVTVYVNFRFYDAGGVEWYYVTCLDGQEGLLYANRVMLIPMN